MVWACLMWLVWWECNTRIFEDNERPLDLLKSLLFGTLFQWAHIWGFTICIPISEFLHFVHFSSWFCCICFLFKVFTIVNMMFSFFNKSLITYNNNNKKIKKLSPIPQESIISLFIFNMVMIHMALINFCTLFSRKYACGSGSGHF